MNRDGSLLSGSRSRRVRGRAAVYAATALTAALGIAAAVAVTPAVGRGWLGRLNPLRDGDPAHQILPARAQQEAALATPWGARVSLWSAPNSNSAAPPCRFLQLDDTSVLTPRFRNEGGGNCAPDSTPDQAAAHPLLVRITWVRTDDGSYGVVMSGAVDRNSRAKTAVLDVPDGLSAQFASRDGYFLAVLPNVGAPGVLPGGADASSAWVVRAVDAGGNVVGETNLTLLTPAGHAR